MSDFYKVTISGSSTGQIINTMLYAGRADEGTIEMTEAAFQDLAQEVETQILPPYLAAISSTYTANYVKVETVNEVGSITSPYSLEYAVTGSGAQGGGLSGAQAVAILGFKCVEHSVGQSYRIPKRSYIAFGPISEEDIADDQSLTSAYVSTALTPLAAALQNFSAVVGANGWLVSAMRVGVANSATPPVGAAGRVSTVVVRPYSSIRRSRMRRATGI